MMALIHIIVLTQSNTLRYTGHSIVIKFRGLFLLFHTYLRFTFVDRSDVICLGKKTLRQKASNFREFRRKLMPPSHLSSVAKQRNMLFAKMTKSDISNRFLKLFKC